MFGTSDNTGRGVVYIGQAGARKNGEGLLNRLQEHKRSTEKDYWTEAIVFTTSNNSFGPTEISYLENRFCNLALKANRYEVKNGNDPTLGNITEEKECELEEFIDYAKVIMGTLGHKVFEPIAKTEESKMTTEEKQTHLANRLYLRRKIKGVGTIEATGMQTTEGFVVFAGSYISPLDGDTISEPIKEKRKKAILDANGKLTEDLLFTSPSYAANFVTGKSTNGLISWKDADGNTLKSLEESDSQAIQCIE